jgi:hypothetical protein
VAKPDPERSKKLPERMRALRFFESEFEPFTF